MKTVEASALKSRYGATRGENNKMVAIKDMDCMPTNCLMCSEKCDGVRVCGYDGHEIEETPAVVTNQRDKNCPLLEIITCKDCKHFYCIADCPSIKVCGLHNGTMRISEKFYCADAERRIYHDESNLPGMQ